MRTPLVISNLESFNYPWLQPVDPDSAHADTKGDLYDLSMSERA